MPTKFQTEPERWRELLMEDLGLCPCGGAIGADKESESVCHAVPLCEKFLELDPLEFLRYVRRSRGI
jgi:hypothetical protein